LSVDHPNGSIGLRDRRSDETVAGGRIMVILIG
jgi:hypothetical protein